MSQLNVGLDDGSKKPVEEYFEEIKGLPIRMADRRILYRELLDMYEFESEVLNKGRVKRRICCFRLRKAFQYFKYYYNRASLWESSLREIEIQRGTLTANVFLFIKWTLRFNLILTAVVFFLMILPHYLVYLYFEKISNDPIIAICPNTTSAGEGEGEGMTRNGTREISPMELSECCAVQFEDSMSDRIPGGEDLNLKHIRELSEYVGVRSKWLTSLFLYGFYRPPPRLRVTFRPYIPMLYALSSIIILSFSIVVLVKDIGRGVMEMVLNKESETAIFSDLVFCGFYHRADDEKDARFRRKLWLHELKVALKRAKAMTKVRPQTDVSFVGKRFGIFVGTTILIILTGVLLTILADYSYTNSDGVLRKTLEKDSIGSRFLIILWSLIPPLAVSLCNFVLPNIFIALSRVEKYSLEVKTAVVLFRSLIVRLLPIVLTTYKIFSTNHCQLKPNTCVQCEDGGEVTDCWESLIGQTLYKVIFVELCVKVVLTFAVDPIRKGLGKVFSGSRVMRKFGTLRFNVIRHSLDIINVQVLCWMGFYFAPAYPFIICFYLFIISYLKKFAVLHNCTGSPESHRVTRTTTIFQMGELFSLLIVTGFVIVVMGQIRPSRGYGPFAEYAFPWK